MLIGWTLKDAGWITLCAPVALPAALLAFVAEAHLVATGWRDAGAALLVHHFADGCWLLGNAMWMMAEFLYADGEENRPGRQFPWYFGPLLGDDDVNYTLGVNMCRIVFAVGLLALLGFYALCLLGYASLDRKVCESPLIAEMPMEASRHSCGRYGAVQEGSCGPLQEPTGAAEGEGRLVFGLLPPELYLHLFIGPWIAKDLAWTFELKLPLVFFSLVTLCLGADYVRRFGGEVIRAELLWMIGDTVWAYGEVWQQDWKHPPREAAAVFLGLALLNVVSGAMRTLGAFGQARSQLLACPVKDEGKPFGLAAKGW